ncbi:MAG TPA: prepilin-type N-terminal cleavage/methylation domain-containing protein [Thermoguttaceae bacterium]|nr:prepilin-type N-terminal cleavage/methylation domain-containing protein [Thermoguttaceae bacterium]
MKIDCRHATPSPRSSRSGRGGFSLLEVILALAIFAGVLAALGEVSRIGMRNAEIARDLTKAQLLCESKMAEITSGYAESTPVDNQPLETADAFIRGEIPWVYSIQQEPCAEEEGLIVVRVIVKQDLPPEKRPVTFVLDRWLLAEAVGMSEEVAVEEE